MGVTRSVLSAGTMLFMIAAPQAMGSEVRVSTLGFPTAIDDPVLVFPFPSEVVEQQFVLAEIGTPGATEAYAAGAFKLGRTPMGGAISREQSLFTRLAGSSDANDLIRSSMQNTMMSLRAMTTIGTSPARPIDLFWGQAMGERRLGLRLTMAGDINEEKSDAGTTTVESEQLDIGVGYAMPQGANELLIGVRLGVLGEVATVNEPAGGTKTENSIERGVALQTTVRFGPREERNLAPTYKVILDWMQPKLKTTETEKANHLLLGLEAGTKAQAGDQVAIFASGGFFYFKDSGAFTLTAPGGGSVGDAIRSGNANVALAVGGDSSTQTGYGFLLSAGSEVALAETYGLMVGMRYGLWGRLETTDKNAAGDPKYTTNLAETGDAGLWSFGAYYGKDSLRFEGSLALKAFVHNGPFFVSGTATGPLVGKFAVSYVL